MTPTQKAKELYDKMKGFRVKNSHRKKCALVAVESHFYSENDSPFSTAIVWIENEKYWLQVKEEIEKL